MGMSQLRKEFLMTVCPKWVNLPAMGNGKKSGSFLAGLVNTEEPGVTTSPQPIPSSFSRTFLL